MTQIQKKICLEKKMPGKGITIYIWEVFSKLIGLKINSVWDLSHNVKLSKKVLVERK